MAKITKTFKKAGSLPGQYQKISITFVSRNGSDVKVNWDFYAKSLGWDTYVYSVRHNRFKILCGGATEVSRSYQAHGNCATYSASGTFTVSNVKNADDDLVFYYLNERIWATKTNSWDPRSTGVVEKTKIGTLSIPANNQHSVDFDELVNDKIHSYKWYHDSTHEIPNLKPTNSHFDFKGWTLTDYAKGYKSQEEKIPNNIIKSGQVDVTAGKSVKITKNLDYYAVWRPKTCSYKFYDYNRKLIDELTISHTWNTETKLPNLDKANNGKYKQPGYDFKGWVVEKTKADGSILKLHYNLTETKFNTCNVWPSSGSNVVKFYASDTANSNNVIFHFPKTQIRLDYTTDEKFSMERAISEYDSKATTYSINPGYNLVGWSTVSPDIVDGLGIAMPGDAFNTNKVKPISNYYTSSKGNYRIYPYKGKVVFDYKDFNMKKTIPELHLYPYYEYYTTAYVYTSSGEWKLAMPYVYTSSGTWEPALSYIYTSSNEWKL